jgi:esterase/lipase superfamily enzyme
MQLLFLALLFFVCSTATLASDAAPRFLRVPVFFVTDRNQAPIPKWGGVDFGPHRKYIGECKHDPFMGTAYCVIENVEGKQLTAPLKALGWTAAEPKDKVTNTYATAIAGDNFESIEKQLYDKVHQQALLTNDKTFLVFAHGYKYIFKRALFTAAKLAYYEERPLILYSWPSVGKLRSYSSDENNVEWSQDHFNDMVVQLEKLCADDPSVHIRMLAHSMGNRLVIRATPLLREQKCFTEFDLICPDIDDGLVQHYARRYLSTKGTAEIRLYMSEKDKALAFSQLIHGGYNRFGECADALGGMVTQVLTVGQKSTDAANADKELKEVLAKNAARMQTIDFTNIDLGWMGHSIPAKLISSMTYTDGPPPELKLVKQDSGQRGKTSNYFAKITHTLVPASKEETGFHAGECLRVVKVSAPSNKVATKNTTAPGQ